MKIAFLHYHLRTGGVTTVLKQQIAALQDRCEILVLTGDRAGAKLPCRVVEIPGLGYDRPGVPPLAPDNLAGCVLKTLSDMWPGGCDLLHVHNPTLSKNRNLIQCIKWLQASGITLFLQVHDFAEDGRPGVYTREPYPADCHYGVINARDKQILVDAGLKSSGVHLIPNAVTPLPSMPGNVPEGLVLYPVRAIRRKNIGEAVLLSLCLRPGQYLGITQPPNSQQDRKSYLDWKAYVKKNGLNVDFDMGQYFDFPTLVAASSSMVTTSISEGFGFSFLEPWTAGKVLWGRRLGSICSDFEGNGLCLDTLYNRLDVPMDWFDADQLLQTWKMVVMHAAEILGHSFSQAHLQHVTGGWARDGLMDFCLLNEPCQRQVISHLLSDPDAKQHLQSLNPRVSAPRPEDDMSEMCINNRKVVSTHYGLKTYRDQLLSTYHRVVHEPVHQRIDKQAILDAFFDLERFFLLEWGTYEG
jgi:hypothetical protein